MEPTAVPGVSTKKEFKVPEVKTSVYESSYEQATSNTPAPTPTAAPPPENDHTKGDLARILTMFMHRLDKLESQGKDLFTDLDRKRRRVQVVDDDIEEVHDSRPQSHDVRKFFQGSSTPAGSDVPRSDS